MLDDTAPAPERSHRPDLDVLADVDTALWKHDVIRVAERSSIAIEVHDGEVFLLGHTATGSDRGALKTWCQQCAA